MLILFQKRTVFLSCPPAASFSFGGLASSPAIWGFFDLHEGVRNTMAAKEEKIRINPGLVNGSTG
jgi:hypothetical protein